MDVRDRSEQEPEPISVTRCRELLGDDADMREGRQHHYRTQTLRNRRNVRDGPAEDRSFCDSATEKGWKDLRRWLAEPKLTGGSIRGMDVRLRPFGTSARQPSPLRKLAGLPSRSSPEGRAKAGGPEQRELEPDGRLAQSCRGTSKRPELGLRPHD